MKRKKPNKKQRQQLREVHVRTFNEGFTMGYNVAHQEIHNLQKENAELKNTIEELVRDRKKIFSAYRGFPQ